MKEIECKDRSGRRNEMKEWADVGVILIGGLYERSKTILNPKYSDPSDE